MGLKGKLDKLERQVRSVPAVIRGSTLADEVREIDREIKRLEAEIAEDEASMTPEELAQSRAEHEEFMATFDGLELNEKIEALTAEISRQEADLEAEVEGVEGVEGEPAG